MWPNSVARSTPPQVAGNLRPFAEDHRSFRMVAGDRMARELRERDDHLTGLVLEHHDRGLRVDVAVEVFSHNSAIFLAHEVGRAVRSASFAVVGDAALPSFGPPDRDRLEHPR